MKLIVWILVFLTSCDFKPLYQRDDTYRVLSPKIIITGGEDDGFYSYKFKKELAFHMEYFASQLQQKPVTIKITLNFEFGGIGYGANVTVLRSSGRAIANVEILNDKGTVIYKNMLDAVSSYTLDINEEFSNLSAQDADRNRIVQSLAQSVAIDIKHGLKESQSEKG